VPSIFPSWIEINAYLASIGPGVGRPARPVACEFCDGRRIWFDGWRWVFCAVLADGEAHRFDAGLPLQRACCAECESSWTLRPAFLYPHRSLQPDVAEGSAFAYLSEPAATYREVGAAYGCSPRTVWRWVGWLAGLLAASELLAEAERLCSTGQSAALIPRLVPQDHQKAYSPERQQTLLRAFQGLAALAVWTRGLPIPPLDPSPLRFWLMEHFHTFRKIHHLVAAVWSPALPVASTGPPPVRSQK